jgi:hypothetical protein
MKKARTKVLMQAQIEQAMKVTRSNRAAAEYLRVGYNLYKRFAKAYKDQATGRSLFDVHLNRSGKGISKAGDKSTNVTAKQKRDNIKFKLDDILTGKHPQYPREKLLARLVVNGYMEEKCNSCGYCTKRSTDFRSPLVLHHTNNNIADHRLSNLEILCYNCYFIQVGELRKKEMRMSQIFQRPEKDQASSVPSTQETLEQGIDPTTLDILTDEEKQQLLKSLENL